MLDQREIMGVTSHDAHADVATPIPFHEERATNSKLMEQKLQHLTSRLEEIEIENESLRTENQRLNHQSSKQLEMFASMVHELRTPLNCMNGLVQLLLLDDESSRTAPLPETSVDDGTFCSSFSTEQRESVKLIASSCDLLRTIVDHILDFSKLESGNMQVNVGPTRIRDVVDKVVDTCSVHAKLSRNVTIRTIYDNDGSFPEILPTDSRFLRQILFNLIGNAIKFSHHDGNIDVKVSAKAIHNESSNKVLCISVKDYGIGIEKEHVERIFKPFEQCEVLDEERDTKLDLSERTGSSSRCESKNADGGTGLGLSMTSKMVKSLGGFMTVDSVFGQWSDFTLMLPCSQGIIESTKNSELIYVPSSVERHQITLTPNRNAMIPLINKNVAVISSTLSKSKLEKAMDRKPLETSKRVEDFDTTSRLNNCKVLIAEDNLINQKVLKRVLQKIGLRDIDVVNNGKEAVDITLQNQYDVIFMDIQMPIMDGFDATRLIRDRNNARITPASTFSSIKVPQISSEQQIESPRSSTKLKLDDDSQCKPKIIFLSAHTADIYLGKTQEVGGDGFISKPFQLPQIQSIFKQYEK